MRRSLVLVLGLALVGVIAYVAMYSRDAGTAPADKATREIAVTASGERAARGASGAKRAPASPALAASGLRLEGQVIDAYVHPVAGVRVTVDGGRSVVTERDGSFAFDAVAEGHHVVVADKGLWHGEDTGVVLDDTSDPVMITLYVGAELAVRVVDSAGAAVSGAEVTTGMWSATTGGEGVVHLRGVEVGRTFVRVSAPGYGRAHELATTDPALEATCTIVLQPAAKLAGKVVDEAGAPVADAFVMLSPRNGTSISASTDDHGAWEIDDAGAGSYVATASSLTFVETAGQELELDGIHPRTDIVLRVEAGGEIAGRVIDGDGHPIAGATVQVSARTESTGADGRFVVGGLAPDSYAVTASTAHAGTASQQVEIARKGRRMVELVLRPSSITGVVVDASGHPIEDAEVIARSADPLGYNSARSDEHGRFDLGGLPPGDYTLTTTRNDQALGDGPVIHATTDGRPVRIVLPDLVTVTGRVVHDGAPVAFVQFALTDDTGNRSVELAVGTNDGTFAVYGVPAGTSDIAIAGPGLAERVVKHVALTPGATVDLGEVSMATSTDDNYQVRRGG